MGCTQSKERKSEAPVVAPAATTAAVAPTPVTVAVPAEVVQPEPAVVETRPETPMQSAETTEAPCDAVLETTADNTEEACLESSDAVPEEKVEEVALITSAEAPATVEAASTAEGEEVKPIETEAEAPVVAPASSAAEKAVEPREKPAVAVPTLSLQPTTNQRPRSRTPSRKSSNTVTPRGASTKENQTAKAKTPSRSKTPKRGLGVASVNTSAAPVRKVTFDAAVPTAQTTTDRKAKLRKVAGRHGSNVNEDIFLASVAAFERQLTHRGTLQAHLDSR